MQVFQVRGGKVVERIELVTESDRSVQLAPELATAQANRDSDCDILEAAVQQFYQERTPPPEIHLPVPFPEADTEMLEGWLSAEAGRRVRFVVPRRGEKRGLLELAIRNAEVGYQQRFNENVAAHFDALETLRSVLALPSIPRRIECFDISTIQGSDTVASMVVCEDGRMKRAEYRKFRIRGSGLGLGLRDSGLGASDSGDVAGRQQAVPDNPPEPRAARARHGAPSPRRLSSPCAKSSFAVTASCSKPAVPFPI